LEYDFLFDLWKMQRRSAIRHKKWIGRKAFIYNLFLVNYNFSDDWGELFWFLYNYRTTVIFFWIFTLPFFNL
jgi:hypothetical protein